MLYYLGKGTEFKKEECKEYKTKEGAVKALKKAGCGTVWDETGKVVADEEQEEPEGNQDEETENVIWSRAKRVTVICDGTLNLRRSAKWGNENICGRASKGQSYYVDAVRVVDGRKMLHTVDGIYLSGEPEHVRLEE